jgi:hypothetical protein
LFDKALANPNYIPVYMKVYYLFTLCLFKVGRLFSNLAIPKYMFVFVIRLSKEKTYFMYGWTWEIEHKIYCLLLTWVSVWDSAPYFYSSVSNVNFVLWRGGPEIVPICPDVDSMCWMCNYRNIFIIGRYKSLKVHFSLIYYFCFETYRLICR